MKIKRIAVLNYSRKKVFLFDRNTQKISKRRSKMNAKSKVFIYLLIAILLMLQILPVAAQSETPPSQLTLAQMKNAILVADGSMTSRLSVANQLKGKESSMTSVITIGSTIILGTIIMGGFALFLKSEKPILKWGGLFAFGIGLFSLLLGFALTPPV